jgi:hypothetical protein
MKVKVSQTIDIDEVPDFVGSLVSDCRKLLLQITDRMHTRMYDVPGMVQNFEESLDSINLVEVKLQDAINIAVGWAQATQETLEGTAVEVPTVDEPTGTEDE